MSDLARDLAAEFRKLQATEGNEPIRCSRMHFGDWAEEVETLDKQLFDMGGLNDAWALECDQIKAQLAAAEARAVPADIIRLFEDSSFCPNDAIGGRPETGTAWNTVDIEINPSTESEYSGTDMYYVCHWNGRVTRATQRFAEWSGTHDGVLVKALIEWLQSMTQAKELEKHLSAAECANVALRAKLATLTALLATAEADVARIELASFESEKELQSQLAAAEARLTFTPSPEQWQETQSQLRAAKERLATAEARIAELESRPIKNMGQIVREFSEDTEPAKECGDARD